MEQWEARVNKVSLDKQDMNRMIMNFLVTEGYVEAARAFEEEAGVSPGVELDSITTRMNIRSSLQNGEVEQAIEQVNDMNPEILEREQTLLFHLHQQQLIELIRDNKVPEALEFATDYLAPAGEENTQLLDDLGEENTQLLDDLERTVALLAFEKPQSSPLGDLMGVAHRHKTATELNSAILLSKAQDPEPRLVFLLKLLVWSQTQLAERASFPRINNLSTGELEQPRAD